MRMAVMVGFPLGAVAAAAKAAETFGRPKTVPWNWTWCRVPALVGRGLAANQADMRAARDALGWQRMLKVIVET